MNYKVGDIVKIKRRNISTSGSQLEKIKAFYDPLKEISPSSFYIIIEEVYPDNFNVKDLDTGYTEAVNPIRFYGDRRHLASKARELKINNLLD